MAHSSTPGPDQDRTSTDATQTPAETGSPADSALVSRRSLRAERTAAERTAKAAPKPSVAARTAAPAKTAAASATTGSTAAATKPAAKRKGGWAINVAVMTVATGIIATMSIPAFAFNPDSAETSAFGTSAADSMKKAQAQTVEVGTTVASAAVARDAASATTEEQLASQKAAAAAEAARQRAAVTLTNYANSYSGPSVSDFLANPPYPNFSLASVFSVAQQYIGTPYVFGGASPAGFDCSGYVQFVYAQFGVSLLHSVSDQAAAGKRISIEDAQPGDLVIMSGHDGFYAGNGNIMDAPEVGRSISVRPIWTSDFYIVRLGI
ncbi:C40 family peptidase [Leifsonia sp. ZF2019]|uniref:C40 family peptidase n=1 Tax=Leifsonia sp. ZF2019 TaxID=2781978 RepID=UPI001CC117B2|nr:C40 family peptidase [Leifsonia sp. ZF2019]UAJ78525.1 C40 family peptidase [Leifsonia sp. ZF2019]